MSRQQQTAGPGAAGEHASSASNSSPSTNRQFAIGLARAFGGAIFFSMPLLMTMEMWWLGFYMDRLRLVLFMVLFFPLLVGLSHFAGFEETRTWMHDVVDALVAYFVGFVTAALVLWLMGVLSPEMTLSEIIGKISLQAVPASVGASLAVSQLGGESREKKQKQRDVSYGGELFLMAAGAIFFAFNVAPTEEMILIAFQMTAWQTILLSVTSLLMMHAFVYAAEFHGQEKIPEGASLWSVFFRFTVVGYAIALLVSAYVLWTFGRYGDSGLSYHVSTALVLGFPASVGAAAARLIL